MELVANTIKWMYNFQRGRCGAVILQDCVLSKIVGTIWSSPRVPPPVPEGVKMINEHVCELYAPGHGVETELEVVFVHGLHPSPAENRGSHETAFWETWLTTPTSSSTEPELWPRTWLAEKFPTARVLSLVYSPSVNHSESMYSPGEWLLTPLMLAGCGETKPVVLVGHSFGGTVIKQIVLKAKDSIDKSDHNDKNSMSIRQESFLGNLKGFFFFATPHHGSKMMDELPLKSGWLHQMTVQSKEGSRLNGAFKAWLKPNIAVYNVFEGLKTTLKYRDREYHDILVAEASANSGGDQKYEVVKADHFSVCKPGRREDSQFQALVSFIDEQTNVRASSAKPAESRTGCS